MKLKFRFFAPRFPRAICRSRKFIAGLAAVALVAVPVTAAGTTARGITELVKYPDGRPAARYVLPAQDAGVVLRHGDGPEKCDVFGARDVWVWEHEGIYYMHYDGAGPQGWLACRATSKDLDRLAGLLEQPRTG